ncbi:DUF3081 family protein [Shewanella psychrotolerans]|uniref:DUF3081 family protein n=1 Tax=Shewanella psychrotolerans TaxID=2864206 RepID=UPI001C66006B|nr:DUF3081 family protein [Shewanella psychrotolerans]QYK02883.1 DUF3081 domain-containing protein [Shewanella psychrotolerans]
MNIEINLTRALHAYGAITSKGTKGNNAYVYQGVTAWSDFDGYTCYIQFNKVTLTLLFHGKYLLDYPNQTELSLFLKKLNKLAS